MIHNVVGGRGVGFPGEKALRRWYGSALLALRGVGGGQISRKKRYVTLEWPHTNWGIVAIVKNCVYPNVGLSSLSAKKPKTVSSFLPFLGQYQTKYRLIGKNHMYLYKFQHWHTVTKYHAHQTIPNECWPVYKSKTCQGSLGGENA